jgi:adenylate cyclase
MNFRNPFNRKHVAGFVGAVLAAGCGWLLLELPMGKGLVFASYDLLHVWRGDLAAKEAVMIYLDEVSHLKLGQPQNAVWSRALHAQLIDRLSAAGARVIVFDVVFSDPSVNGPAADEQLAKAVKDSGRVILAADNVPVGRKMKQMVPPFPLLLDAAAGVGSAEVLADPDLVVRRHTPEEQLPSLSWVGADFVGANLTVAKGERPPRQRWMNYYGPPNFLSWTNYYAALDPALTKDDFFRGKAVVIGARIMTKFAGDRKDEYRNPFSLWLSEKMKEEQRAMYMAGVEVQATAFLNLLRGDWLTRTSPSTEHLLTFVLGLAFGFGLVRFHPFWASVVAFAGMALIATAAFLLFVHKFIWVPWLIATVQIAVGLFWSILFNSIQLYVEKRLYEQTLRLYLPPNLVKKFARSRAFLKPGAEKQTLTLLFSDIANFTTITEGMDSDELANMMNQYFEMAVAKCIHKADGTVAKYLGDSIFAFWNAPDEQPEHAVRACEAALLFQQEAAQPVHGRQLRTRIGLHTGVANVGNFGSEERVDYTALGENVNLASRLEGLNKHLGTHCLLSGATRAAVGDRFITRPLGRFQLKGFEGLVEVHELVGWANQAEQFRSLHEAFAEALNNYEQRNLEFAELGFRRVLELQPGDGPAKFYLARIAELSKETLPDNWATYTILKEK